MGDSDLGRAVAGRPRLLIVPPCQPDYLADLVTVRRQLGPRQPSDNNALNHYAYVLYVTFRLRGDGVSSSRPRCRGHWRV